MGMIKNWVKVDRPDKFKDDIIYRNYTTKMGNRSEIRIHKGGNVWIVNKGEGSPSFFHAKTRALMFAMKYMRSHPNG